MTTFVPSTAEYSKKESRSASLARSITWSGSKHSYLIAGLMADPKLRDDCYRAYAYFRWADDEVDDSAKSDMERIAFIHGQREHVRRCYGRQVGDGLTPEEQIIADLIRHSSSEKSGLDSFITKFLDILEFDAHRRGKLISQQQLTWYSSHLGLAVTDGIQYFVSNGHPYPRSSSRHLAATAAHITHMLRDMVKDIPEGFINIPIEYLSVEDIDAEHLESTVFRNWVRQQVELARDHFSRGKQYIDGLDVLRCKLAAHWYCARFECVLDAIEQDNYILRAEYSERRSLLTLIRMARDGLNIIFKHFLRRRADLHDSIPEPEEPET